MSIDLDESGYDALVAAVAELKEQVCYLHHDVQRRQDAYTIGMLARISKSACETIGLITPCVGQK